MNIIAIAKSIINPVRKLIDDVHTSDEERLEMKEKLTVLENEMTTKFLNYENKLLDAQSNIIIAEAQGESWLQRMWRPILMTVFTFIIFWNHVASPIFGLTVLPIPDQMWSLLNIGVGGYVIGRSFEKAIKKGGIKSALKGIKDAVE